MTAEVAARKNTRVNFEKDTVGNKAKERTEPFAKSSGKESNGAYCSGYKRLCES